MSLTILDGSTFCVSDARGDVAETVCEWVCRQGGALSPEDFATYRVVEREPVEAAYRGRDVLTNPPPSSGGILIAYALDLLERAGGVNVVDAPRYPQLAMEAIVATAPEVILQTRMDVGAGDPASAPSAFWSRWSAVPAVAAGRVIVFDGTPALRPGPRVGQAVAQLAAYLHPHP